MPEIKERDPYTPPPMHHDRSGAVLRVALLAAMLGTAGLGYAWMQQQPRTALVPEVVEEQQMADAGYRVAPEAIPDPAPAATPAPRRTAPAERAPEPAPAPQVTPTPDPVPVPVPVTATPIPPVDMPPAGTVGSM
ncbi:MAG: hypothetical protein R3C30_14015 [Hyphomonadaceae bacterium]